jgi:hypothetical protein
MDILTRLKRLKTSLNDINANLQSSMSIKSPGEIDPEDELGMEPEEEIESGEVAPDDIPLGDEELSLGIGTPETPPVEMAEEPPQDTPEESEIEEEAPEGPEDTFGTDDEVTGAPEDQEDEDKPQKREWEPIVPPDNDMKSLSFKSNKEKIFLDMKRTDINDRLWLARLYKDDKILEYGQVIVPEKAAKDPITYILGLADGMLDRRTLRYEGEWQAYYDAKKKATEEPPPEEIAPAPAEEVAPAPEGEETTPESGGEEDILGDLLGEQPAGTEETPVEGEETSEDVLADLFK